MYPEYGSAPERTGPNAIMCVSDLMSPVVLFLHIELQEYKKATPIGHKNSTHTIIHWNVMPFEGPHISECDGWTSISIVVID